MISSIKAVGKLTVLKLFGAIFGLVYSVLQVRYFGANGSVDAYFVATSALYLVSSLTQGGQLAEVFLPEYIKEKERNGIESSSKLLSAVLNRVTLFLIFILLLLYFGAYWVISIMGPGLVNNNQELATSLFQASLILILFNIIASFINTTLNAEQVYGRAEVTALVNSIISVGLILVYHNKFGIWILIYALLIGKIVEFLLGLYYLNKIGFRYKLVYNTNEFDLNKFFKVLFTTSGYVGATQLFNVILTAMASLMPEGILSIFSYTRQLSSRARSIILTPINTVFFSKFSKKVAQGESNLASYLRAPLLFLGLVGILQICLAVVIGKSVLQILWKNDQLTEPEFQTAYIMLILNTIGIAFIMMSALFRKSAVALGGAKKLYFFWTLSQLASAIFSFFAVKMFGVWGLSFIPLFNMIVLSIVSVIMAKKQGVYWGNIFPLKKNRTWKKLLFILSICLSVIVLAFIPESSLMLIEVIILKGALMFVIYTLLIITIFKKELLMAIKS
ncbi:murein biosynthesis integral membrane protein MurJ [Robiginitalea aurantiaca]|uniref:Lipid II flippase MurJ n=1 Tax=Robiginitalea aurantiaca TaxID=3056915 RepID=A0ABT7WE05_9FLAO|nr:lipid II flippase MurJ [Robiginitalea aurantiaca]MDM9631145.1 lipid II flippase MurJ [Robiginitalea aurantiaca]